MTGVVQLAGKERQTGKVRNVVLHRRMDRIHGALPLSV